jgi:ribonuclease HI
MLFFDGASKSNPGEVGGGGVLLGFDEKLILKYSWGLGIESNNLAEALALWQGLAQAIYHAISDLTVVGDSRLIIQSIIAQRLPSNCRLRQILRKIQVLLSSFRHIDFFHVLRKHNDAADQAANEALPLGKGYICLNGDVNPFPIP